MRRSESKPDPSFWCDVIRVYRFPIVVFALAIIPGLNFTYSGHGGISWFVIPLCFPWIILRALIRMTKGSEVPRKWYQRFFRITIPCYIAFAFPLSWAATTSIRLPSACRFPPGLSLRSWYRPSHGGTSCGSDRYLDLSHPIFEGPPRFHATTINSPPNPRLSEEPRIPGLRKCVGALLPFPIAAGVWQ